jgi:predicted transcriptional regulator
MALPGRSRIDRREHAQRETFLTTTLLTVDLPPEVKDRLDRLAERTRRNRSLIAGEAIADYARRELAIIDDIEEARAEVRAGRIVPHDQVMDEVRAIIEEAEQGRWPD